MRNRVLRLIILLAIFVAGVSLFSRLQNQHSTDSTTEIGVPTLPVMCIDWDGDKINRMAGYTTEMDAATMREGIIPVTTDRQFSVSYKANENHVISVAYEITAPDTGKVVENAKIGGFREDGDYMTATVSLTEPILMNREYPVRFTIETSDGDVYFYSRIVQKTSLPVSLYVQFVYNFYEACMNKDGPGDLNTYLETDNTITNTSFTNVNIKSTLDQVTWGSLSPQILRKAVPTITEINNQTCSVTNDYLIQAVNESGETEVYHVWEYYRLRYYNGSMNLLNFNRRALEVYDPDNVSGLTTEGVNLGVAERSVQFMSSASADIVAFVQDGALWEYNESAEKLSCVFSLKSMDDGSDERADDNQYAIRLIRVSEGGDIDFTVYGYMNRGDHEGQCGISVCHYINEQNAVRERAFLPSARSYFYLNQDLEKLNYISTSGMYYAYLNGCLCALNPDDGTMELLLENVNPDCFVASSDGSAIAWMPDMDKDASTSITVMDLESGESREITAESGTYLRALGFLNDDLLYGIASADDITAGPSGEKTFAMRELRIESFDGTLVKDYEPGGVYVTEVSVEGGLVELTRARKEDNGTYTEVSPDNIMNNKKSDSDEVVASADSNSRQGTTITLTMPETVSNLKPLITRFGMAAVASPTENAADSAASDVKLYLAYGEGTLQGMLTDPGDALLLADQYYGTVLDPDGAYVYERGNEETRTDIDNADIPNAFLTGEINADTLQTAVGDTAEVLDLTGATLDQVLYEVGQGRAVAARRADGTVTVIVGYDPYNTLQYNFETGEHYYVAMDDSREDFEAGGNVFVSYVLPQQTIKS